MEWTKEILTEFIEMYRERPCLWKIKDVSYINKNLKREAYKELIRFLKSKNYTNATVKDVKTKIQNIRNAFRRQCKKIESSNRSGSGTKDICSPTLWYYNLLSFTKDQDAPLSSPDSILSPTSLEISERQEDDTLSCGETEDEDISSEENTSTVKSEQVEFKQPLAKNKKRKQEVHSELNDFMKACTKTVSAPDTVQDEFDATCIYFAAKLRKMNSEQQIFAESLMHKVCTQGLLNRLHEHIDVVDNRQFGRHNSSNVLNHWQQYQQPVQTPKPSPSETASTSTSVTDYYNNVSNESLEFDS